MTVNPLSAQELKTWLDSGEEFLLLDVRTPQEYAEWRIQTDAVPQVNIAFDDFQDESKQAWQGLPTDQKIAVICRRGRTAMIVSQQLVAQGFTNIYCLNKGMQEWSQFYHPVTVAQADGLHLIQMQRLGKGCLSYLIVSNGEAMVVDPGRHVEEYIAVAEREGAKITYIMDTHLHADHISGARELKERTGANYFISQHDMTGAQVEYEDVGQYEQIQVGQIDVKVLMIATPGHTLGSVSFLVNDQYLLTGDTIFVGGLGRPDLGGKAHEWAQKLYDTVFQSVAKIGDDVIVLPAHFSDIKEINSQGYVGATLGTIRQSNEVMRTTDREQFTSKVVGAIGATPPNYTEIVEINRGLVAVDADKKLELESGPNRCAVKHQET